MNDTALRKAPSMAVVVARIVGGTLLLVGAGIVAGGACFSSGAHGTFAPHGSPYGQTQAARAAEFWGSLDEGGGRGPHPRLLFRGAP